MYNTKKMKVALLIAFLVLLAIGIVTAIRLDIGGTSNVDGLKIGNLFTLREFNGNFGEKTLELSYGGTQSSDIAKMVVYGTSQSTMDLVLADGKLKVNRLSGTGNAYACINSAGEVYRSATGCV